MSYDLWFSRQMNASDLCLPVFLIAAAIAAELPAQVPTPESTASQGFNQVFVKVILPVTSRTPKQGGIAVESWVAKQLKKRGKTEYFAVTNWVPVCDALLEDEFVDNDVWDGYLDGTIRYCPVSGDVPERKNDRVLVSVVGWLPFGVETNIELPDEPGSRAVRPVQLFVGEEGKSGKADSRLPFVAIIITPPPQACVTPAGDEEETEQIGEPEASITGISKRSLLGDGPVTAGIRRPIQPAPSTCSGRNATHCHDVSEVDSVTPEDLNKKR